MRPNTSKSESQTLMRDAIGRGGIGNEVQRTYGIDKMGVRMPWMYLVIHIFDLYSCVFEGSMLKIVTATMGSDVGVMRHAFHEPQDTL